MQVNKITFIMILASLKYIYILIILILIVNCSYSFAKDINESPYQNSYILDGSIIGTGFVNAIIAYSIDKNVTPLTKDDVSKLNKDNINSFDRWSINNYSESTAKLSDGLVAVSIISPLIFLIDKDIRNDWSKIFIMYSEDLLWSASLPFYCKGLAKRNRPYAYYSNAPLDKKLDADARKSFFSSHTCVAFSSAIFVSKVYSDYFPESEYTPYIYTGSILFAGTIGYLRIKSGEHFLSDVIAGAAVGSAVGYVIPYLHEKKEKDNGISFQISPNYISISYKF